MLKFVLAIIGTVLVAGSYVPQLIKGFRTKTLRDLAYGFLLIMFFACLSWISYGFVAKDYIILTANVIIMCFVVSLSVMKFFYSKEKL